MNLRTSDRLQFNLDAEMRRLGLKPARALHSHYLRGLERKIASRKAGRSGGVQVERIFEAVIAGLGCASALKREDRGELLTRGAPASAPNYRILMPDKAPIIVEVKSSTASLERPFKLPRAALDRFENYASLSGDEFRLAVFWARQNVWTLLPPEAFHCRVRTEITFPDAMLWNQMNLLGDYLIGSPYPLKLSAAPSAPGTRFFAAHRELSSSDDRQLALFLIYFGDWDPASETGERPEYVVQPGEIANPGLPFEPIGIVSTILSRHWRYLAAAGKASEFVPPDFARIRQHHESSALPLWRFEIEPKYGNDPQSSLTDQLNSIYAREPSALNEVHERLQADALPNEEW